MQDNNESINVAQTQLDQEVAQCLDTAVSQYLDLAWRAAISFAANIGC